MTTTPDLETILRTIYGEAERGEGLKTCIFHGVRNRNTGKIDEPHEIFGDYPSLAATLTNIRLLARTGQDVYVCAHLLTRTRRIKPNAARFWSLYADIDGASVPPDMPRATIEIESSPGRKQGYWALTRSVAPEVGEQLNKRLAYAIGADASGWDRSQLLRVPGTPNHKYDEKPIVKVIAFNPELRYDPDELDRILPPLPEKKKPAPQPIATAPLSVDDDELLRRCLGNEKFRRLHHGDDSDYAGDESSGDLGYCNIVVRNGGTAAQIDRLYRQSARTREKWDERRGDSTYGAQTIGKALDGTVVPFVPAPRIAIPDHPRANRDYVNSEGQPGVNRQDAVLPPGDLPDDVAGLKAIIIDLQARVAILERSVEHERARAAAAEERCAQISHIQSRTASIFRNKDIGQKRFTGIALINRFANRESAGDAGNERGLYRMPLKSIAGDIGASPDTISKHVQELEDAGLLRREVKWVPDKVDTETGEIVAPAHKDTFIGLPEGTNVTDFVEALANLKPEKPSNWGGIRIKQCEEHPDAKVIRTTVWSCAVCGEELGRDESKPYQPNRQDADLLDEGLAATGTEGADSGTSLSQRGLRPHISVFPPSSHNTKTDPLMQEALAAWGRPPTNARVDQWTDVTIGGRN